MTVPRPSIEGKVMKLEKKKYEQLLKVVMYAVFWGILAHGMTLFNKYSWHDDNPFFNRVGVTWRSGRWMLGLTESFFQFVFGSRYYSFTLLNGLATFICIGVMLYLIYRFLGLENRIMCILITGIFIVFPAIAGVFGYMYTAPFYYMYDLVAVCGACIWFKYKNIPSMLAAMILIACATGVYQVNLTVGVCTILLLLIDSIWRSEKKLSGLIMECVKALIISAGSLILYLLFNKLALFITHETLTPYKGISSFGSTDAFGYLGRIGIAYREFFWPSLELEGNMYPFSSKYVHVALIVVFIILAAVFLAGIFKKNASKGILMTILFAVFPLAAYLVYVMVELENVSGLMTYSEVFTFLLAAWIFEKTVSKRRAVAWLKKGSLALMLLMIIMLIRFDNLCYLKSEYLKSQAIAYDTALIGRITSTKGYTPDLPVVYVNQFHKREETYSDVNPWFEQITLTPYNTRSLINDYQWRLFMRMWCGYLPVYREEEAAYKDLEEVKEMPSYPSDGSIRIVNGHLIVKF